MIGWIFYIFLAFIIFVFIEIIDYKYSITKLEKSIISLIILMFISGFCFRIGIPYTNDIFLIFVFLMIIEIIYNNYFIGRDFLDPDEKNVLYYVFLIIFGFIINQEFINRVNEVFLTGEELRLVLWFLSFLFVYNFFKSRKIFNEFNNSKNKYLGENAILVNYAKLKYLYHDQCKFENDDLTKIVYSIMVYQNSRRTKIFRCYDYFMFKIKGGCRKLGIMQIETNKFITDVESIDIVYKQVLKLYNKKSAKSNSKIDNVLMGYSKDNYDYIKYIYDIIEKI